MNGYICTRGRVHAVLWRRLRDNALYNNLPVDAEEVEAFLPDVATLLGWLEQAVDHLIPGPGQPSPTSLA
jgi:hypothetical protein